MGPQKGRSWVRVRGTLAVCRVRGKITADGLNEIVVADRRDGPVDHDRRIRSWPTFFAMDSDGTIRRRVSGPHRRRPATSVEELVPKTPDAP